MAGLVARIFHKCVPFCVMPICLLVYLFQTAMYDFYLIHYSGYIELYGSSEVLKNVTTSDAGAFNPWYLITIPDLVVLALFITAFVKVHQKITKKDPASQVVGKGGELPFGYIAWGSYSLLNVTKVALIFRWIAPVLPLEDIFGTNMVKMVVSLSCIVWITLVLNHHDAEAGSSRESFINFLAHSVTMDVLDTTEILQVIMYQESKVVLTYELQKGVIAVACINLLLPTVLLVALSKSRFGRDETWMKYTQALHKILHVILVNVPLLVLRVILWKVHKQTVSVFIIKNCLALGIMVRTVHLTIASAVRTADTADSPDTMEMVPIQSTASPQRDSQAGDNIIQPSSKVFV